MLLSQRKFMVKMQMILKWCHWDAFSKGVRKCGFQGKFEECVTHQKQESKKNVRKEGYHKQKSQGKITQKCEKVG